MHISAKRIKEARKQACLTQKQFAKILGCSQAAIAKWENGKYLASIIYIVKIAKEFNVTVDYLLGITDF